MAAHDTSLPTVRAGEGVTAERADWRVGSGWVGGDVIAAGANTPHATMLVLPLGVRTRAMLAPGVSLDAWRTARASGACAMPLSIAPLAFFAGRGLCARHGGRECCRDLLLRAVVSVGRLEVRDLGVVCVDLAGFVSELKEERQVGR